MSSNDPTINEAMNQVEIALKNLANAIIEKTICKNLVMKYRVNILGTMQKGELQMCREILKIVSNTLDVNIELFSERNKKQYIVDARHIYFYMIKKILLIEISYAELGKIINRDHASVMHSCAIAKNLTETDFDFRAKLDSCVEAYHEIINSKNTQ